MNDTQVVCNEILGLNLSRKETIKTHVYKKHINEIVKIFDFIFGNLTAKPNYEKLKLLNALKKNNKY